jgi:hypothetical protein
MPVSNPMNKVARFARQEKLPTQAVPRKALQFAADIEVGSNGEGSKSAPITLTARSKEPVDHWWWGRMVHDMAGFSTSKPKLPIDYCHNDSEVMGYANKFETASGELVASGALTPFDDKDRASEVLFKSKEGVPYEASIYFDPDTIVLEYVPQGMSVAVNGYQFEGPGVIARQWTLRGIAVCPHGYDRNTSVEFKDGDSPEVAVKFTDAQPTAEQGTPAEVAVTEITEETPAEVDTTVEAVVPETPAEEEPVTTPTPTVEAATALSRASDGKKFLTAFGAKGGVWFAEGKTFEESQTLFTQELQTEVKQLQEKNTELQTKLTARRGEKSPVSFQVEAPSKGDGTQPSAKQQAALGDGLSKFAAGLVVKK